MILLVVSILLLVVAYSNSARCDSPRWVYCRTCGIICHGNAKRRASPEGQHMYSVVTLDGASMQLHGRIIPIAHGRHTRLVPANSGHFGGAGERGMHTRIQSFKSETSQQFKERQLTKLEVHLANGRNKSIHCSSCNRNIYKFLFLCSYIISFLMLTLVHVCQIDYCVISMINSLMHMNKVT